MDNMVSLLLSHRSIRKFEDKSLTDEQIKIIVSCAQSASSSSFVQAYSIIGIKDKQKKKKLAEIAGNQPYVADNGHLFVFCADLYRHEVIGRKEGKDVTSSIESTEKFMVGLIDAALASQNAAIAAESMGLGICYIGGIRNNLEEVKKLLKTPDRVIPLFAMAVGYPNQSPDIKPRLPFEHIYHEDEYEQQHEEFEKQLTEYDAIVSAYYEERTSGKRRDRWTEQIAAMLENQTRMYMKEFITKNKMDIR